MAHLKLKPVRVSEYLGVDYNAGRRRHTNSSTWIAKKIRRRARLAMVRRYGGAFRVAKAGVIPSLLYGQKVFGANGGQIAFMRRMEDPFALNIA